ncbi:tRNA glutamyl-Q(34) synthetase GluQRS [Pseudomonas sp. F1_0610]|uniref:tRNA glutamyl-Q(34) synthetase GluQRS n=1 Tax=Pseudomonas sp. F1_0610 TaxID=3114284 RepID=UPI0039C0C894
MTSYIGRFAPTPSGPLHFGSLLAALASYLDAKAVKGKWLLRIEDTDPLREPKGACDSIIRTLEAYGLHWDGEIIKQSQRHRIYQEIINDLLKKQLAYHCDCSRSQLQPFAVYPNTCRNLNNKNPTSSAIRIKTEDKIYSFIDRIQGVFKQNISTDVGDFIIKRKDQYYAYQLAVVVDDGLQGITDVVRGADLLDNTPRQLYLQKILGYTQPNYLHIPLITMPNGQKLSKSYRSEAIDQQRIHLNLLRALKALGQTAPSYLKEATAQELLCFASAHWDAEKIPKTLSIPEAQLT